MIGDEIGRGGVRRRIEKGASSSSGQRVSAVDFCADGDGY